jgi:hypothetical protein
MSTQEGVSGGGSSGERPDGGVTDEASLSTDAIFETLSSRRRRFALHYLKQRDEPVGIRDLSEQVAAWENGTPVSAVTPKERKRVYTALHQTHLPKMDKLGVVEHDRDRGIVQLTDHVQALDIYLDVVSADDLPWSQFYLGIGAVLTALTAVGALGVYPFSLVSGYGYALSAVLTFTAVAAYHTYRDRDVRVGGSTEPKDIVPPAESPSFGAGTNDD